MTSLFHKENIKQEWVKQLYSEFETICYTYNLKLQKSLIEISQSESILGCYSSSPSKISLSESLILNHPWEIVLEIFKHEIAHQIVQEIFQQYDQHGIWFQKACDLIGLEHWARHASIDIAGHLFHWKSQNLEQQQSDLLRKVERLLALVESNNEFESAAAMQKVHELYAKYNLEIFEHKKKSEYVSLFITHKKKKIETYQSHIFSILAEHFSVKPIFCNLYDPKTQSNYKAVEILGTKENILMGEYVYWFLYNNLHSLWNEYKFNIKNKTVTIRNSYFLGVIAGLNKNLNKKTEVKSENEIKLTSLMIIEQKRLADFVKWKHPKLVSTKISGRKLESESYNSGKQQGLNLQIHKGMSKTSTKEVRYISN